MLIKPMKTLHFKITARDTLIERGNTFTVIIMEVLLVIGSMVLHQLLKLYSCDTPHLCLSVTKVTQVV